MDTNEARYWQPHFYRFNSDSITLVKYIKSTLKQQSFKHVLDFCCGSGVIGLELSQYYHIEDLVFYDIQKDFEEYVIENIKRLKFKETCDFLFERKKLYSLNKQYDCIVMNPPYFLRDSSRLPECEKRKIARFYKKGELEELVREFISLGSINTRAFFCINKDHNNSNELSFLYEQSGLKIKEVKVGKLTLYDITLIEDKST